MQSHKLLKQAISFTHDIGVAAIVIVCKWNHYLYFLWAPGRIATVIQQLMGIQIHKQTNKICNSGIAVRM